MGIKLLRIFRFCYPKRQLKTINPDETTKALLPVQLWSDRLSDGGEKRFLFGSNYKVALPDFQIL